MEILELLVELILFLDYEGENFIAQELLAQHKDVIMREKPHQMELLLMLVPYQYFIPWTLFLLSELTALDKVLVHNRGEIDLAPEGIVLDLLVELVEGATEGVFEEALLYDESFGVEFVINVQPTGFAVHDVISLNFVFFELL